MLDLADVDLERPEDDAPPPRGRRTMIWFAVGALVAVLGAGAYFYMRDRTTNAPANTPTAAAVDEPGRSAAVPTEAIDLPPLDESDGLIRDMVKMLSAHPGLAVWLAGDQLARTFAAVVDNISGGQTPVRHLRRLTPQGKFQADMRNGQFVIDPQTYARYDGFAAVVDSIDAEGTARAYRQLKPLLTQAYRELGHPDGNFDEALAKAVREILETPIVEGPVTLKEGVLSYEYADASLEARSNAQKQLMRMGPANVKIVQAKVRQVADAIGFAGL